MKNKKKNLKLKIQNNRTKNRTKYQKLEKNQKIWVFFLYNFLANFSLYLINI